MGSLPGRGGSAVTDAAVDVPTHPATDRHVAFPLVVAAAVGLAFVARVRFFFTPMTADEGGVLAIGRAWRHGARLYRDVWVDRPQGLLALFRAFDVIGGGRLVVLRMAAFLFAALAVASGALLCRTLAGERAGAVAAVVVAAAVSAAAVEGFSAAGELLSGAIAITAVAVAAWAVVGRGPSAAMAVAGVLAVLAVGVKQSAYDAAVAIALWLALAWARQWIPRRAAAGLLARYLAGGTAAALLFVADGTRYGVAVWWEAVVGHRLRVRSVFRGIDWHRFGEAVPRVWPAVAPLVGVATAGLLVRLVRTARRGRRVGPDRLPPLAASLLLVWCLCAVPAFSTGGQFYEHYWLLLMFPFGCAASVAAAAVEHPVGRGAVLGVLLVPCLVSTALIARLPREQVPRAVGGYGRSIQEEAVAAWFRDTARPGDRLYVMCASASVYAQARVDPPYPYLWIDAVRSVPGAAQRLASLLSSPTAPRYVALFQAPSVCDPSGRVGAAFAAGYRRIGAVRSVDLYERVTRSTAPPL